MMVNQKQKLVRYKKLEDKKPTIIFSCNPVNYNLIIKYTQYWNTSRSLFVDALIDYGIQRYKENNKDLFKHIDEIVNAKKYADMDKNSHL